MLDINLLRSETKKIEELLRRKDKSIQLDLILKLDEKRRNLISRVESLRAERNKKGDEYGNIKAQGKEDKNLEKEMKSLREEVLRIEEELRCVQKDFNTKMAFLPNIPWEGAPIGGKEVNKVVKTWGSEPQFDFAPKDHVTLAKDLDIIDFNRAVKMAGSQFIMYKGMGARLEFALWSYFLEKQIKRGYTFILPPHIISRESMFNTGQLPKFEDDVYSTGENEQFLVPTAESVLVNIHSNEILNESDLPIKYTAYTPCYRKEAGGYRAGEKGLYRIHQFNKIECVRYVKEEDSLKENEEMVREAEELVEELGLRYQTTLLGTLDMSYSMVRTFDVEVYMPTLGRFGEVSSASTAGDYQSRRSNTKYKTKNGEKKYVHILNASGLATSRLMISLLENYQRKDGSIIIPKVLRKYMGDRKFIKN